MWTLLSRTDGIERINDAPTDEAVLEAGKNDMQEKMVMDGLHGYNRATRPRDTVCQSIETHFDVVHWSNKGKFKFLRSSKRLRAGSARCEATKQAHQRRNWLQFFITSALSLVTR